MKNQAPDCSLELQFAVWPNLTWGVRSRSIRHARSIGFGSRSGSCYKGCHTIAWRVQFRVDNRMTQAGVQDPQCMPCPTGGGLSTCEPRLASETTDLTR